MPSDTFLDYVRTRAGRVQLGRWAGGCALGLSVGFALFAWYARADVPLLFWPVIAGGGALFGLHICHLRWQATAGKPR
jgi:hypothetical protein